MDAKGQRGLGRLLRSFRFAARGFLHTAGTEQNMQLHLAAGGIVFAAAWYLPVDPAHIPLLIFLVGGMLALETMNTAIERTVDLITEDYHPLAKTAKDIAAAAVLIYAVTAAVVGVWVFYEPILQMF